MNTHQTDRIATAPTGVGATEATVGTEPIEPN
jgi:hypothetical protein